MSKVNVLHIIDSLDVGGEERVAVNLVNFLPRDKFTAHLCTTRYDGPLENFVAGDVRRLRLTRKNRFDFGAFRRLVAYIRQNQIKLLHAHGTSLFIAALASLFSPYPSVVWHAHYGRQSEKRDVRERLFKLALRRCGAVIAVSHPLMGWIKRSLGMQPEDVWYIPNFVTETGPLQMTAQLEVGAGARILCVANLRPEKDQLTMLRAMKLVNRQVPTARLLLVGATNDRNYAKRLVNEIAAQKMTSYVTILGPRNDAKEIMGECDIGVLSSVTEGLPMTLLEYGMAGLPVVATQVGQCAEVLDEGRAGRLVPPSAPDLLAAALLSLLRSTEQRLRYGAALRKRVEEVYGPGPAITWVGQVYEEVLKQKGKRRLQRARITNSGKLGVQQGRSARL
jgi:glycosyltransferase involved in cell wall biosynthesis